MYVTSQPTTVRILTDGNRFFVARDIAIPYRRGLFGRTRHETKVLLLSYGASWCEKGDGLFKDYDSYAEALADIRLRWGQSVTLETRLCQALPPKEK